MVSAPADTMPACTGHRAVAFHCHNARRMRLSCQRVCCLSNTMLPPRQLESCHQAKSGTSIAGLRPILRLSPKISAEPPCRGPCVPSVSGSGCADRANVRGPAPFAGTIAPSAPGWRLRSYCRGSIRGSRISHRTSGSGTSVSPLGVREGRAHFRCADGAGCT